MKHISCVVGKTVAAFANQRLVTLGAPDLPRMRPGQFLLRRVNDTFEPYLPSAYFPLALTRPGELAILVAAGDPICYKAVGESLELIAPVGNGFTLDPATRRLLLVGDAARLAPLLALAHEASQKQLAVSLLVQADGVRPGTPEGAALTAALSEMLPLDVEYQLSAEPSTVLPELLRWADQLCAAGDAALYAQLRASTERAGQMRPAAGKASVSLTGLTSTAGPAAGFAQVSVAPLMACGFGACRGCAVETIRGIKLACVDGPVFDLGELNA